MHSYLTSGLVDREDIVQHDASRQIEPEAGLRLEPRPSVQVHRAVCDLHGTAQVQASAKINWAQKLNAD